MFKNHLTLGYILLVGVPLLILATTLRGGARLAAPPAVAGEWAVQRAPGNCGAAMGSALGVQQVGTDLLITLADRPSVTLAGTLEGGHITASGHTYGLEATVSGKPEHRSWQGHFSAGGPDACPPVEFQATKSKR